MHANCFALAVCCAVFTAVSTPSASAANLCVNPTGWGGCYKSISAAVSHASAHDTILVGSGVHKEDVVIGMPLSLLGAGAGHTVINATGLANGVFIDGFDNAGLSHVTITGFTVENAQWEGVLVVSASDITIRDNTISNNTKAPAVFTGDPNGCAGQPAFEMDETGDCGGGSPVRGTVITQNIITDEQVDVAVNTPAPVNVHLNDLLGGNIGVANVCAYDNASACTGGSNATENYWGCARGPGGHGCTTTSGVNVVSTPWLLVPATDSDHDRDHK
jgi:parallel beta-helix repeat protein